MPTFYYSVAANRYHGGVMITQRDDVRKTAGFKIVRKESVPMSLETGIGELRDLMQRNSFAPLADTQSRGPVSVLTSIVDTQMLQQGSIALSQHGLRTMNIVIDTGNGMGAPELQAVFKRVEKVRVAWLGTESTDAVRKKIIEEKADFGIAVDGDGDQLVFFDESGKIVAHEVIAACVKKFEPIYTGAFLGHHLFKFEHGTFESPVLLVIRFIQYMSSVAVPVSSLSSPVGQAPLTSVKILSPFRPARVPSRGFSLSLGYESKFDYVLYVALAGLALLVMWYN